MRIVAGKWKGRVIAAPKGEDVRPTADKVREAWMSIVHPRIAGARVLDLFAGSGALGLEALSRGASSADFVEIAAPSLRALRDNIAKLGADDAVVHRGDALAFAMTLEEDAYDLAFADPPYAMDAAVRLAERWMEVPFARTFGIEHAAHVELPGGGERRRYGTTSITLFHAQPRAVR